MLPANQVEMPRKEEHLQDNEGSGQVREGLHSDNQCFEKNPEERREKERTILRRKCFKQKWHFSECTSKNNTVEI